MDPAKKSISSRQVLEAIINSDSDDELVDSNDDSDIDPEYDAYAPEEQPSSDSEAEQTSHNSSNHSNELHVTISPECQSDNQPSTSAVSSTPLSKSVNKRKRKISQVNTCTEIDPTNSSTWHLAVDNSHANNEPVFQGKPKINVTNTQSPFDIFSYFFNTGLLDDIVYNTNLYSIQKNVNMPLNLTRGELMIFLGINVAMTYIRYPRLRMYWSSDSAVRCAMVADAMSVNRFEAMTHTTTLKVTSCGNYGLS
jgi:hypothetical protein